MNGEDIAFRRLGRVAEANYGEVSARDSSNSAENPKAKRVAKDLTGGHSLKTLFLDCPYFIFNAGIINLLTPGRFCGPGFRPRRVPPSGKSSHLSSAGPFGGGEHFEKTGLFYLIH